MNPIPFPPDDEPLAQSLRQLQPSSTPLDPAMVFYRMGLAAGRQQQTRSVWPAVAAMVLAASLSAVIVGPVGYRLGQASSSHSEPAAPDTKVLPLNEPEPMLAQSEPEPPAEEIARETDQSAEAEVATGLDLPPAVDNEQPKPEQFADVPSWSWPPLQAAIVGWLWGDALERPIAEHRFMLTRRLTAGHSGEAWFHDGVGFPHAGFTHSPDADSGPGLNNNPSPPRPKRRESLRASDWKEIVDKKNQIY